MSEKKAVLIVNPAGAGVERFLRAEGRLPTESGDADPLRRDATALLGLLNNAMEDIYWMSAASDFGPEGQAHEGWVKVRNRTKRASNAAEVISRRVRL